MAGADDPLRLPPRAPAFDDARGCWILSRYADVEAALLDPRIALHGAPVSGDNAHLAVRAAVAHALSPARLEGWRSAWYRDAYRMIAALPGSETVDLLERVVEPWSLDVAVSATGVAPSRARECATAARRLFRSAADATTGVPDDASQDAAAELSRLLQAGRGGPDTLADVQTFVALSQSLPALLAAAWLILLPNAAAVTRLRTVPGSISQGVGELLRVATPTLAIFRVALEELEIGGAHIRRGERIALLLGAANRDPARFPDPDRLDLQRDTSGHLTFGTGLHRCAGASLVRMALSVATEALIASTASVTLASSETEEIAWIGGFALRAPASLPVVVQLAARRDGTSD